MRTIVHLLLCGALCLAACKGNPNSVKDQAAVLKDKNASTPEKLKAVANLRKIGKSEIVPALCAGLKTSPPKVKAEIAVALGEMKDTAAMMPLAEAIELTPSAKQGDSDAANEKIARALGDLGGKGALPQLVKLYGATGSNYVKFEVLTAFGKIGGSDAVPMLLTLALDEKAEAPFNKKAMAALAMIAPKEALPVFLKGLFYQRGALAMYPDAAFGLFRLRQAAFDPVLALLTGKDQETLEFAKAKGLKPAVITSIAAQVAGHLRDPRLVPVLIKQLRYKDADPDLTLIAQTAAVEALGRMKAKAAVPALAEMLRGEDRVKVALALSRIGDKSALPKLVACANAGGWNSREPCIQGIVALGGKAEARQFDALIKGETAHFLSECKAGDYGEVDCAKERVRVVEERTKSLTAYKGALEAVGKCEDTRCLVEALGANDAVAREKAAYAVAEKGDLEALPALLQAADRQPKDDGDLFARVAAVLAADWIATDKPEARTRLKGEVTGLQAAFDRDSKVSLTAESTEELQRLIDVIQYGRELSPPLPASDDAAAAAPAEPEEKPAAKPVAKPAAKKKGGKKSR